MAVVFVIHADVAEASGIALHLKANFISLRKRYRFTAYGVCLVHRFCIACDFAIFRLNPITFSRDRIRNVFHKQVVDIKNRRRLRLFRNMDSDLHFFGRSGKGKFCL